MESRLGCFGDIKETSGGTSWEFVNLPKDLTYQEGLWAVELVQ
jgi:hypothetical protein